MKIKNIAFIFTVLFWPLSLFMSNINPELSSYLMPALLLCFTFILNQNRSGYTLLPIIIIPFFSVKLAIFPLFFLIPYIFSERKAFKKYLIYLFLSLLPLIYLWKPFIGQTILIKDYEAQQEVIRNTHLYSSVFLARLFHNKARIISDKFTYNFFAITDPGNYFFSFHPREDINNQNLIKFPFLAIFPFLFGLYYFKENRFRIFIFPVLFSALISLSFLTNFDRNDFILWFPIILIIKNGFGKLFEKYPASNKLIFIYLFFSLIDFIRIFYRIN